MKKIVLGLLGCVALCNGMEDNQWTVNGSIERLGTYKNNLCVKFEYQADSEIKEGQWCVYRVSNKKVEGFFGTVEQCLVQDKSRSVVINNLKISFENFDKNKNKKTTIMWIKNNPAK